MAKCAPDVIIGRMQLAFSKRARSTLSPGVVTNAIASLRDAAIKEMDRKDPTRTESASLKFDDTPRAAQALSFDDDDNGVARCRGVFSPHIGNGSGGPR